MGGSVLYELNIHVQLHIPRPLFSSLFSDQLPRMDDEPRTLIFFLFSLNPSHEILHIVSYWVNLS